MFAYLYIRIYIYRILYISYIYIYTNALINECEGIFRKFKYLLHYYTCEIVHGVIRLGMC